MYEILVDELQLIGYAWYFYIKFFNLINLSFDFDLKFDIWIKIDKIFW